MVESLNSKANKVMPYSAEAEKAVLGSILTDPNNFINVSSILHKDHFYIDDHRIIYEVIADLDKKNLTADVISVAEVARYRGKITNTYLSELIQDCPITLNIEHYAAIVKHHYTRRQIIQICQNIVKKCLHYDGSSEEFLETVQQELLRATEVQSQVGLIPSGEILADTVKEIEVRISRGDKITGVSTGFRDLDAVTGGWQPSDLIILAARPGMGKTALALNCALTAVREGSPTAIFSLEMSRTQLMARLVSAEARVDSSKIRRGNLNERERDKFMDGVRRINKLETAFSIDDTPAITISELRSRCRRFKHSHGLGLIIIDYLQLIGRSVSSRYENREREISEISRNLKALSKELYVPIISLAQLNRSPDARPDKRPLMSDLRESGSMEQDADLILFIYRDEYYHKSSEDAGKAEIIIGKNRHGPMETIDLAFMPSFVSFHNFSRME